jgi:hypothetical protein
VIYAILTVNSAQYMYINRRSVSRLARRSNIFGRHALQHISWTACETATEPWNFASITQRPEGMLNLKETCRRDRGCYLCAKPERRLDLVPIHIGFPEMWWSARFMVGSIESKCSDVVPSNVAIFGLGPGDPCFTDVAFARR